MWRLCENVSHDTTVWCGFTCVWCKCECMCKAPHNRIISSILCLMRCVTFISISIHAAVSHISTVSHVCIVGLMTAIQNNIIRFIAIKLELFNYDFLWGISLLPSWFCVCVCLRLSGIDSKQIQKHKPTMTIANTNEIQFSIFCPLSGVNQQFFLWRNRFVCRSSEMYAMWEMICLEMAFKRKFKCVRQCWMKRTDIVNLRSSWIRSFPLESDSTQTHARTVPQQSCRCFVIIFLHFIIFFSFMDSPFVCA